MEMGVGEAFPKGENFSLPTDRTQSNKRNNAPRSRANVAGFFLLRLNDFFLLLSAPFASGHDQTSNVCLGGKFRPPLLFPRGEGTFPIQLHTHICTLDEISRKIFALFILTSLFVHIIKDNLVLLGNMKASFLIF